MDSKKNGFTKFRDSQWFLISILATVIALNTYLISQTTFNTMHLGSNEASMCLDFEPNIVNIDSFLASPYLENFHFSALSYSHKENLKSGIYTSPEMKPKKFYHTGIIKIPILFSARALGYPYFFIKEASKFTTPMLALRINLLLTSIITLIMLCLGVYRCSGKFAFTLTTILVGTSPAFLFFGSNFPDTQWATMLSATFFYFIQSETKKGKFFAGILLWLTIATKLSFLGYLVLILWIFRKSIWSEIKYVILGFSLFLPLYLYIQDYHFLINEILQTRSYSKDLSIYFSGLLTQFFNFLYPDFLLESSLSFFSFSVIPFFSYFFFVIFFLLTLRLIKTNYKKTCAVFLVFISYSFYNIFFSKGLDWDLYHYQKIVELIFLVLFSILISFIFKRSTKKIPLSFLVCSFILGRLFLTYDWYRTFEKKFSFFSYTSSYEIITRKLLEKDIKYPITLFYENVGQLEFFSKGTITPTHLVWKFSKGIDRLTPEKIISRFSDGYLLLPIHVAEPETLPLAFRNISVKDFQQAAKSLKKTAEVKEEFIFKNLKQHYTLIHFYVQK